jgi:hypothetical protein
LKVFGAYRRDILYSARSHRRSDDRKAGRSMRESYYKISISVYAQSIDARIGVQELEIGLPCPMRDVGNTAKLADLPCCLDGLRPFIATPLLFSSTVPSLAPRDTIETDLWCLCPMALPCPTLRGPELVRPLPAMATGTVTCIEGWYPRLLDPSIGLCVGVPPLDCKGAVFLSRSAPGAKPLYLESFRYGDDFVAPATGAMFLKVTVHSTSSPAKTVCSAH